MKIQQLPSTFTYGNKYIIAPHKTVTLHITRYIYAERINNPLIYLCNNKQTTNEKSLHIPQHKHDG